MIILILKIESLMYKCRKKPYATFQMSSTQIMMVRYAKNPFKKYIYNENVWKNMYKKITKPSGAV